MSELQYGTHSRARETATDARRGRGPPRRRLLRNNVTDEEVAEVVSKWTGIPVAKMLEGEKEKLLQMEQPSCASASSARTRR